MYDFLTINFDLIPTSLRTAWENNNRQFYYIPTPAGNLGCVHAKKFIQIARLSSSTTVVLGDWIKENGLYICYNESNLAIEEQHFYQPTASQINTVTFRRISWGNLKTEIGYQTYNHFEAYVKISYSGSSFKYTFFSKYSEVANCYSIPLFNSIVANNHMSDNDIFEFGEDGGNIIFFRTVINGNVNKYYDITRVPYLHKLF